jgi:hypothetical protein
MPAPAPRIPFVTVTLSTAALVYIASLLGEKSFADLERELDPRTLYTGQTLGSVNLETLHFHDLARDHTPYDPPTDDM